MVWGMGIGSEVIISANFMTDFDIMPPTFILYLHRINPTPSPLTPYQLFPAGLSGSSQQTPGEQMAQSMLQSLGQSFDKGFAEVATQVFQRVDQRFEELFALLREKKVI